MAVLSLNHASFLAISVLLLFVCVVANEPALANGDFPLGQKSIYLKDNKSVEYPIGGVDFSRAADETITYTLHIDTERFTDFFLSMKEMKCLEGKEIWCFIPYPYQHPRSVSRGDLRWLEHDLLFMFKTPSEFGANLWNGIYYDMTIDNGAIHGTARAVDLNAISSPPDDLTTPPYGEFDIEDLEPAARWLPYLEIR
ncbi:MAG: hypothetical protein R3E57_00590 [Porticoccaceae bacterium]